MKVTTGARFNGRTIDMTLEDGDGLTQWGEDWLSWPVPKQMRKLGAMADVLLVAYASREGLLTPEEIETRLKHQSEVLHDD